MDQNQQQKQQAVAVDLEALEKRPAVFMIGPPNVGKRTLLSRLLSVDFEDASDLSSDVLAYGWTINTKYYTADVSVWMAHLEEEFSIAALPIYDRLAALVMVFDMSDLSSFNALKEWVSCNDIQKFDILLCIGNKVDLLPGHPAHIEYRRHLLKRGESSGYSATSLSEYGISEHEGSSLLGDEVPWTEIKRSCLEWCVDQNIEFIEACASNLGFDKCLSMDGDSLGVERLYGALSAHMWPGMVLKSGDKIIKPSLPEQEELSEEESDYELEYERLSAGSAEPWDDTYSGWVTADDPATASGSGRSDEANLEVKYSDEKSETRSFGAEPRPATSTSHLQEEMSKEEMPRAQEADRTSEVDEGKTFDFEDLEQLMSEIGNVRNNLRLMPDYQRREMAAKLAMKMAAMFGDSSGDEEGF